MSVTTFFRHGKITTDIPLDEVNMLDPNAYYLSDTGEYETREAAKKLKNKPLSYDLIVCCNNLRCRQTAIIIQEILNIPLTIEESLSPWKADVYKKHLSFDDYYSQYTDFIRNKGFKTSSNQTWESFLDLKKRMWPVLERYMHMNKNIIFVGNSLMIAPYINHPSGDIKYSQAFDIDSQTITFAPPKFIL